MPGDERLLQDSSWCKPPFPSPIATVSRGRGQPGAHSRGGNRSDTVKLLRRETCLRHVPEHDVMEQIMHIK